MSAAIGHGTKLPRKAEQAIAAPHNQQPESTAIGTVLGAVPDGTILPSEGQLLAALTEAQRKSIETVQHEERMAALEGEWKC